MYENVARKPISLYSNNDDDDTKAGAGSGSIWPVGPAPGRLQKSSPIPMA